MRLDGERAMRRLDEVAAPDAPELARERLLTDGRSPDPLTIREAPRDALLLRQRHVFDDGVAEDHVELSIREREGLAFDERDGPEAALARPRERRLTDVGDRDVDVGALAH